MKYLIALGLLVWLVHIVANDPILASVIGDTPASPAPVSTPLPDGIPFGYAAPHDLTDADAPVRMVA